MPVMFVADGVLRTGLSRGHAAHKTPSTPWLSASPPRPDRRPVVLLVLAKHRADPGCCLGYGIHARELSEQ